MPEEPKFSKEALSGLISVGAGMLAAEANRIATGLIEKASAVTTAVTAPRVPSEDEKLIASLETKIEGHLHRAKFALDRNYTHDGEIKAASELITVVNYLRARQ